MTTDTYNGWTNYATWRVNLEVLDGWGTSAVESEQTYEDIVGIADALKEFTEEAITGFGEIEDCLATHYALAFVGDVNFYEIAKHIAEDYPALIKKA